MPIEEPPQSELTNTNTTQERAVDDAAEDILEDLARTVRRFAQEVNRRVLQINEPGESTRGRLEQLNNMLRLRQELEDVFVDAGLDDVLAGFGGAFPDMEQLAYRYFESYNIPESQVRISADVVDGWIRFAEDNLIEITDSRILQPVRSAILGATIGNQSREEMRQEVTQAMEAAGVTTKAGKPFTNNQVNTYVHDSFRRFQRQVTTESANRLGMRIYQYIGPLDKRTSEQCRFLLLENRYGAPGFWLESDIKTGMHPAIRENPLVAGGHFNCRHKFYPVTYEYAVDNGWRGPRVSDREAERAAV